MGTTQNPQNLGNQSEAIVHTAGAEVPVDPRPAALALLGLTKHEVEMRKKFHECFVCRGPMNYMRMYQQKLAYCEHHEDAIPELKRAIELMNA